MKKQIFAMMLSAAVLCGTAAAGWTAEADLRPDIDVVIDGAERTFYNASGAEVHPISYQDTTYLPVRAIGVQNRPVAQGTVAQQRARFGMTAAALRQAILEGA